MDVLKCFIRFTHTQLNHTTIYYPVVICQCCGSGVEMIVLIFSVGILIKQQMTVHLTTSFLMLKDSSTVHAMLLHFMKSESSGSLAQ